MVFRLLDRTQGMVGQIKASQVPSALLRQIKGLPKRKSEKITTLADIPPGWKRCDGHGWYGSSGVCPYCEIEDGETIMYVQLDEDYYGHPKTLQLVNLLGQEADTYPPRLWTWAMKYAKDGVLKNEAMLETACRWKGHSGKLAAALMESGFVDICNTEGEGRPMLEIHNWMRRTGHDIEVYEAKKKRLRDRRSGMSPEDSRNVSPKRSGAELNGTDLSGAERTDAAAPGTLLGLLMKRARDAGVLARADTLRTYIEGWIKRSDAGRVEQILMDPWTRGKTVIEIHDKFFPKDSDGGSWNNVLGGSK